MRKYLMLLVTGGVMISATSCKKFLDINENPNNVTTASPQVVLSDALTVTASNVINTYNTYGSWATGFLGLGGGINGYAEERTYNYTSFYYNTFWTNTYDNLNDYQYIKTATAGETGSTANFNAFARIMKVFGFQALVDEYGDIPYSKALQGAAGTTPAYDKADAVYQDFIPQLDSAIAILKTNLANSNNGLSATDKQFDIMFKGDLTKWIQFANTLRLRILIRLSSVSSLSGFVTKSFSTFDLAAGFLTDDAIVNPGYIQTDGKQNPFWNTYNTIANGTLQQSAKYNLPTKFVYSFYDGTKISDDARGAALYANYGSTPTVQLGDPDPVNAINGTSAWNSGAVVGLLKGANAGVPLILAAESYFLLAEAYTKNYLSGDAAAAFNKGIEASFNYTYKTAANTVAAGYDPAGDAAAYLVTNQGNKLANFAAAASIPEKVEAIITQKYIALNMVHGHEAWSEFRRTGYPRIVNGSADATLSFASLQSHSTRPDRLPVRLLYPASEAANNGHNVPGDIDQFKTRIFWDNE